jgi:RNA polymerase sigma-70 factor, ECF subfamily
MPALDELHEIEERLTVLLAQQGDRDAFSRLLDWYDKRLFYFVHRILGETDGALDILQSVWMTVHRMLGKLQSPDAFRVWLYRIAHDQAVSELRRKSKRPVLFEETATLEPADHASAAEEAAFENAELVHVALQDLSVDHRRVLTLHFLEDMPIEEIAEVVGCSSGTVKSRLHYAKKALRRRIEELLND